jgi:hypothetical protein
MWKVLTFSFLLKARGCIGPKTTADKSGFKGHTFCRLMVGSAIWRRITVCCVIRKFLYESVLCVRWSVMWVSFLRRASQQKLRTQRSLKAYCAILWWRWRERWSVFSFFLVMEHRWNEIDRGKPKYSGRNLSQCQFVHHKSHIGSQDRTRASAVRGRRLIAWAMAQPVMWACCQVGPSYRNINALYNFVYRHPKISTWIEFLAQSDMKYVDW